MHKDRERERKEVRNENKNKIKATDRGKGLSEPFIVRENMKIIKIKYYYRMVVQCSLVKENGKKNRKIKESRVCRKSEIWIHF